MLKKFIQTALLLVVLCSTATTYAQVSQAPDGIQFQALATDANGHPAAGRVIYVKDAIVAKTATGTIVYSETFKVTASSAGIFTIVLGKGTYASGVRSIANIDWANGPFFLNLKIAVEPSVPNASWNVNNEYVDLGTSQFWSTPYALYAGNVKGMDTKLNIADTAAMLKPYFTSINLKANIESPTFTGTVSGITKAMVGLGNVDNTADIDKPVSSATQAALDLKANATDVTTSLATKVDKVTGKALSTNDYTTAEKTKLAAITGTNTGDQINITGNAATATKLETGKTISLTGDVTYTSGSFDGTENVTGTATLSNTTVTAGSYGSSTTIPTFTVDSKGRLTVARSVEIASGISSLNYTSATSYAAGGIISGTSLTLSAANGTNPGLISTGSQTIAGAKTFNTDLNVNGLTVGRGAGGISVNTASGLGTLQSNTTGSYNTAYGFNTLRSNTTGGSNTASGTNALFTNTTGSNNTGIGVDALNSNSTGSFNTAIGQATLYKNTFGNNNTANGYYALGNNTTGVSNTANGDGALYSNTTGGSNTSVGRSALYTNTTGSNNTALGRYADVATNNLTNATAIGYGASVAASNSIQLGNTSVTNVKTSGTITAGDVTYPNTTGTNGYFLTTNGTGTASWAAVNGGATSVGVISSASNANGAIITSGVLNLAPADAANGGIVTTGSQTFTGTKTFNKDIVVNSVMIGKGGNTQADNIAIGNGARSGNINTGGNANIAIGSDAQKNNTGFYNVSLGNANLVNGSGDENTALGYTVMANNTSGMRNTGVGLFSFYQNTTGNYNTAIGHGSLGLNTTGSYNTALGTSADVARNNLTNATAIGYGASVDASNSIQLGNTSVSNVKTSGTITAGVVTYPNTHGANGQVLSSTGNGTLSWITPSATATSYSGVLPIENGGTSQTTLPGIKSMLGLLSNNIAIGNEAGTPNQGVNANTIAIGGGAGRGNQGASSIAIGYVSGDQNQGANSISIGGNAAQSGQGSQAVAIGFAAGQNGQGANAVAIGTFAGQSGQAANSIAINATGTNTPLNPATAGFYVDPIRSATATTGLLFYNPTSKEITTASANGSFVDLTTAQTIAGTKTFNSDITVNGVKIGRGIGNNDQNVAVGADALASGTGTRNTAVGYGAMRQYSGTSFDNNTSVGYFNMLGLTTGGANTSMGGETMFAVGSGANNTAIGNHTLMNATTSGNTVLGADAGNTITSGSLNTIIGFQANVGTNSLYNATAIGNGAVVTASDAIQLGNTSVSNVKTNGTLTAGTVTYPNAHNSTTGQVLTINNSGTATWAAVPSGGVSSVGAIAGTSTANGASITSGVLNLAPASVSSGGIVTTGTQTFAGSKTFNSNILVNGMTVGSMSSSTMLGIGVFAGNNSIAIGSNTFVPGSSSIALGSNAFVPGSSSIALGTDAFINGNNSIALGRDAFIDGNNSIALGYQTFVPGSSSIALGYLAFVDGDNSIALGNQAFAFGNNTIQLGNSSVTNVNTSGTITATAFNALSDNRLKKDITPMNNAIGTIMKLNPVDYKKKSTIQATDFNIKESGFIAQELLKVIPSIVTEGKDKDKLLSVNYISIIPILTKGIQEQQLQIETQQKQINELKSMLEKLINKN